MEAEIVLIHFFGAAKMVWGFLTVAAVFVNMASSQCIRCPRGRCVSPNIAPVIAPAPPIAATIVDNNVVQSLIDTLQLFIVSDLLEDTLPEKKVVVSSPACVEYDCDILPYDYVIEQSCNSFVTPLVCPSPRQCCVVEANECVNFGLNEELILPPLAAELPCGLGYLPGALPVVAKAFAPCSKCCGCGCTPCSSAALPICSPCSCAALAAPLCPDLSPLYKPIIL